MKVRNYPAYSLEDAINFTRQLWKTEHRNKIPRKLVAERLGYSGLHGVALRKIGAMKAYGLLEGMGDAQQISSLAVKILEAPEGSRDRDDAKIAAGLKPALFSEIHEHFETLPSLENLRYYLINTGFSPSAASRAASAYLATMGVDKTSGPGYTDEEDDEPVKVGDHVQWESGGVLQFAAPRRVRGLSDDGEWAFVEGSGTGVPVKELTVESVQPDRQALPSIPGLKGKVYPPAPPSPFPSDLPNNGPQFQDVFSLAEGPVSIQWPASLSPESFTDLSAWLDIIKRKIGRSVKAAGGTAGSGESKRAD